MKEMKKKTHSTNPVNVFFVHWIWFVNAAFLFLICIANARDFLNIVFPHFRKWWRGIMHTSAVPYERKSKAFSCIHLSGYATYFLFILIHIHVLVGLTWIPASTAHTSLWVLVWRDSTVSSCSFWAFLFKQSSRRWANCGAKMFESLWDFLLHLCLLRFQDQLSVDHSEMY